MKGGGESKKFKRNAVPLSIKTPSPNRKNMDYLKKSLERAG
jgi:hypothetical protein